MGFDSICDFAPPTILLGLLPNQGPSSESYGFSSSHVWMESWTIKKVEHQRIDAFELVLKKTLESPLDCKEIQPVHPKGNQS